MGHLSKRLQILTTCLAASLLFAVPGLAQTPSMTKVRVGYLHSEPIDVPLIHGMQSGYFRDQNIELQLVKFDNGTQINQALAGGSLDTALAGAGVVQNFAVQGNGTVFAFAYIDDNDLYANPSLGVRSVADIAGKQVAFPLGTTANVLVYWSAEDTAIGYRSVKPVNTGYANTAAALISGAVPSAVVYGAFTRLVNREKPDFVKIADLKKFFPKRAVFGGFVASNEYRQANRAALVNLATAYLKSYDEIWRDIGARRKVYDLAYAKDESFDDFESNIAALPKFPSTDEWMSYLKDGSIVRWALDVAETLKSVGALKTIGEPKNFLDEGIITEAYIRYRKK